MRKSFTKDSTLGAKCKMQFTPEMLWEPPVLWNINSSVHVSLPPTSMSNLGCIHQNRSYQPLLGVRGNTASLNGVQWVDYILR